MFKPLKEYFYFKFIEVFLLHFEYEIMFYFNLWILGNDTTTGSFRGAFVSSVTTRSVKFYFDLSGPVETIEVMYIESRNAAENYKTFNYGKFDC